MPADDYKKVREGMIRCILATDMARHNEILSDFREIMPDFSYENRAHINVVCWLACNESKKGWVRNIMIFTQNNFLVDKIFKSK